MEDVTVTIQPQLHPLPSAGPKSEIRVRCMTADDAAFIARWTVLGFRDKMVHNIGANRLEPMIEVGTINFTRYSPDVYKNFLVAEYEGQPAGFAVVSYHNQPEMEEDERLYCEKLGCWGTLCLGRFLLWAPAAKEGEAMLEQIVVADGFRGKGIGTALLKAVDNRAREENLKILFLWVAYGNRAKNLYERHGFQEIETYDGCCRTWCAVGIRKWYFMVKKL